MGRNPFYTIISDIFYLARGFANVEWSWVSRENNKAAHHLARSTLDVDEKVWWGLIPRKSCLL